MSGTAAYIDIGWDNSERFTFLPVFSKKKKTYQKDFSNTDAYYKNWNDSNYLQANGKDVDGYGVGDLIVTLETKTLVVVGL